MKNYKRITVDQLNAVVSARSWRLIAQGKARYIVCKKLENEYQVKTILLPYSDIARLNIRCEILDPMPLVIFRRSPERRIAANLIQPLSQNGTSFIAAIPPTCMTYITKDLPLDFKVTSL